MLRVPIDQRVCNGAVILLIPTVVLFFWHPAFSVVCIFLLIGHLTFFRDPFRVPPPGDAPVSPADGTIVHISTEHEPRFLKEKAVHIGIFLSIFNVHVNRSPIEGTVSYLQYEPGKFLNALREESATQNESNWVGLRGENRTILVRQIAGAIARRICCDALPGGRLARGQKFGIICYGSRVECWLPERLFKPQVTIGQPVRAGKTLLGEWKS